MGKKEKKQDGSQNYGGCTLCWDCANAVGWCSWSKDFTPVEGWTMKYSTEHKADIVTDCPLFIRDAKRGGLDRIRN